MNNRKVIIVGRSATGKNYVVNRMEDSFYFYFKFALYHTTRKKRPGEKDSINYYFTSKIKMFFLSLLPKYFVVKTKFNNWEYNLSKQQYEYANTIVCSPEGLKQLRSQFKEEDLYVILLVESPRIIRIRLKQRVSADVAERRILADREDFKNLHHDVDFITKSENYGRIIANSSHFLKTGMKFISNFNYKVD
jgi:guanylate kinase